MHVKVTQEFRAVRPGKIHPEVFRVGDVVDGRIAEIAMEQKKGEKVVGSAVKAPPAQPDANAGVSSPAGKTPAQPSPTPPPASTGEDETKSNESDRPLGQTPSPQGSQPAPAQNAAGDGKKMKQVVVRARLNDRWEGHDEKGKALKISKGGIVSAPLAQQLVDEGLATVLETKAVPA
jgi:hypothetical protein